MKLNYFAVVCFAWALVAVGTRIWIATWGERFKAWELEKVYHKGKPARWVYIPCAIGLAIVAITWIMAFASSVPSGWIIATLTTLTLIKIGSIVFRYDSFQRFVQNTLTNQKRFVIITVAVAVFALALIALGIWYMTR